MSFRNNWRRHIIIVEQSQSEQVRDEERENNAYQIFFHSFTASWQVYHFILLILCPRMMSRRSLLAAVGPICALLVLAAHPSDAFTAIQPAAHTTVSTTGASTTTSLYLGNFGKKKEPQEDLSYIETRDLTREEMEAINKQNEDIMNMELSAMTGFSLVLSIPILYLCWVAFFSD